MKVLFVLECANKMTNGTSATCVRFANELRKRGHEVRIIGVGDENTKNDPNYIGLRNFHFPFFQGIIEKEGFNFAHIDYEIIYKAVEWCDIVHYFLPFKLANKTRLIAQALHKPVTGAFHMQPQNITSALGCGTKAWPNNILYKSFNNYIYKKTKRIHCPSEMIATTLKNHGYLKNEYHVISNGVSDFFHPIEVKKPEELQGKFVVTMVGRLANEKRQDLIIKAVAKSRYNDYIQIILCGSGQNKKRYERLAKKVKLANPLIIKFCKPEELREVLNYTDLYVHASTYEIEGISCIEAFACGAVPVVSDSDESATKSFSLNDKECVFKTGDADSLCHRIEFMYENRMEKRKLSNLYLEFSKEFALPRMVDSMEEMLNLAKEDLEKGEDFPTLYPAPKDKRLAKKIFNKLLKKGVIKELPDYCK